MTSGLLQRNDYSDEERARAVEEVVRHASVEAVAEVLPGCADHQLDSVLTRLVTREVWHAVGKVLERSVSESLRRLAVEEARQKADDVDLVRRILPHCLDDQLDSVLTHCVTRGLWHAVGQALERSVSETRRRWAVEEASKHAGSKVFTQCLLPHCADDQLDCVLANLVTRGGMREAVGRVLHHPEAS